MRRALPTPQRVRTAGRVPGHAAPKGTGASPRHGDDAPFPQGRGYVLPHEGPGDSSEVPETSRPIIGFVSPSHPPSPDPRSVHRPCPRSPLQLRTPPPARLPGHGVSCCPARGDAHTGVPPCRHRTECRGAQRAPQGCLFARPRTPRTRSGRPGHRQQTPLCPRSCRRVDLPPTTVPIRLGTSTCIFPSPLPGTRCPFAHAGSCRRCSLVTSDLCQRHPVSPGAEGGSHSSKRLSGVYRH